MNYRTIGPAVILWLMSAGFVLRLFGALTLEGASGRLTKFPTKRSALLLARLAVSKEHRIGRDELAELLWPDDYLDQTRLRLRQELVRLRRSVGDFGKHIRADRQWVEIEPDAMTTDVEAFDSALTAAVGAPDAATRAASLSEAVAHLNGPLLSGYQDPWVLAIRRTYEERARRALLDLADAMEEMGDPERSLEATFEAVRHDPLDQDANGTLIRRLVDQGRSARARQAYFEFDAMMHREFGRRAPASVRALLDVADEDLETNELLEEAPAANVEGAALFRPGPLFGRQELLEAVFDNIDRPGARVVLFGTLGAGKTHTLREVSWTFSRNTQLPVQVGGVPHRVADGLFVIESASGPEALAEAVANASRLGWRVLAESRVRLDSNELTQIPVGLLATPSVKDSADAVLANPAVHLLLSELDERATFVDSASLAELARRLDGHPAALKLFAAHLVTEAPEQALRRVEVGLTEFACLTDSSGRIIQDVIASMVAELPPATREAFYSLAVLGDAAPELAERLVPDKESSEIWRTLERRGLISVESREAARRFRVPYPLAFAARASRPKGDDWRTASRVWHALADWAYAHSRELTGSNQNASYLAIEAESGNIRAAIEWGLVHDPDLAAYLVVGAWRTTAARGNPSRDAPLYLRAAKSAISNDPPSDAFEPLAPMFLGEAWIGAAIVCSIAGQLDVADTAYRRAYQVFEEADIQTGLLWVDLNYAPFVLQKTDPARAAAMSKSVADRTDSAGTRTLALSDYAKSLALSGRGEEAVRVAEQVFATRLQSVDISSSARAFSELGEFYKLAGRPEAARPLVEEGVRRLRDAGIQDLLLEGLSLLAELTVDEARAGDYLNEALEIGQRMGSSLKLLELARLKMSWAARRGDTPTALAAVEEVFLLTQQSESAWERERSFDALAVELERLGRLEYANAVRSALGPMGDVPINQGWRALLSSDSHATLCVLASVLAREALTNRVAPARRPSHEERDVD